MTNIAEDASRRRNVRLLLGAVTLLVVILSGCGSSGDAAERTSDPTKEAGASVTAPAPTTRAPSSQGKVTVTYRETLQGSGPCPRPGQTYPMEPGDFGSDAMLEIPAFLGGASRRVAVVSSTGDVLGTGQFQVDFGAPDCTLASEIRVGNLTGGPYVIEVNGMKAGDFSDGDVRAGQVGIQSYVSVSIN